MQLIHGDNADTFSCEWQHNNKKRAASVTLYTGGLLEYQGNLDVSIENIGTPSEQVCIGNIIITKDKLGHCVINTY